MTDRELLELIATQVGALTTDMKDVKTRLDKVDKTVINIEDGHGRKLEALFDGYKQVAEQLNRIEDEVKKHDEVILHPLS